MPKIACSILRATAMRAWSLALWRSTKAWVEGAQVGIVVRRDQGGHVEGTAQIAVAGAADSRALMHGGARVVMSGVESAVRDPLAHGEAGGQQGQFS